MGYGIGLEQDTVKTKACWTFLSKTYSQVWELYPS